MGWRRWWRRRGVAGAVADADVAGRAAAYMDVCGRPAARPGHPNLIPSHTAEGRNYAHTFHLMLS
eukprot:6178513-Pleurochrysis_carterae.AAC.2